MLTPDDITGQQQLLIDRMYEDNTLVIAQAGAGKTVCAQTAAQELITDGVLERVIIFAPLKVCDLTWATEHEGWSHLWPTEMATGPAPQRTHICRDGGRIVVMNLDNLAWFCKQGLHEYFDGLIIDEGSKLKDPGGAAFKALRHKLDHFKWRICMSATPVHEAQTDIYTQAFIVDGGVALGRNQERFKTKYFTPIDYERRKWEFMPTMEAKLAADIAHLVFVMDTDDYERDLPQLEDVIIPVEMPQQSWDAYDAMCATLVSDMDGHEITAANLAVRQGKLQQLTCGAVYNMEGDQVWMHEAKFEALGELLDGHPEPFVIVYQFLYELDRLRREYPQARVLGDDPEGVQAAWNAGECDLLLVHPKSASHGLNIQYGGCRLVWLSPVWSADQWDQTVRRLRRRGQPSDTVWRYTLMVENSVERLILERHTTKMDNASSFIEHIKKRARA